jgi:predicted CoA-binding protein
MTPKKTLILGASENPERYANIAAHKLTAYHHPIVNIGIKKGIVANEPILTDKPVFKDIDTITLYVGAKNQPEWYDYILQTKPKRIIFNPGTENPELQTLAQKNGIETVDACTLVLLSIGEY